MTDPTYDMDKITGNGVWHIAFILSEMLNDYAPIGWGRYIPIAQEALNKAKGEPK